jgi:hypothetical protein
VIQAKCLLVSCELLQFLPFLHSVAELGTQLNEIWGFHLCGNNFILRRTLILRTTEAVPWQIFFVGTDPIPEILIPTADHSCLIQFVQLSL